MSVCRRVVTIGIVCVLAAKAAPAQQLPSTAQARVLLETRPDLVAQLRQEIANSGLTPDQIRARLRAAGYPEDLLDQFVGGNRRGVRDSSTTTIPVSENVLDAVAALGIADSVSTRDLRDLLRRRRSAGLPPDTLGDGRPRPYSADSLAILDSLGLLDSLPERIAFDSLGRPTTGPSRRAALARRGYEARVDSGLTVFGLSVFRETSQFDPNLAGPVDANYRLGPGDRLVLLITGDAERAYTLDVTREGFIVIPGIGQQSVANLTLNQLEDLLYPALGRVFSGLRRGAGATTRFSLSVARLHTNQIVVLGDVDQPGAYRVSSAGTALTALYAAGGPTKNGNLRRVEIRRGGKLVDSLDLYDYLLRGDASHDPRLQSGDVVFVPMHGARVRVWGEVMRPGTYELRAGETLVEALGAAGGFTDRAARRRVQVERILPPAQRDSTDRGRVLLDVTGDAMGRGTVPAFPLEAGDVVRAFPIADRVARRVVVRGNVWTPSAVGYTTGMRLSDALRTAGGVRPDVYLGLVLVSRLRAGDSTRAHLRTSFADSTGRPVDDMALREDDEVRVFAVGEFRVPDYVAITGAVRRPGRFPYRSGMTMRDLVILAGGLDRRAALDAAEIARMTESRDGAQLAETRRVPLDSSYVLARSPGTPAAAGAEIVLQPFDNVLILPQPGWTTPRLVTLTGEVKAAGTYTLTSRNDRLRDVLERAGGLTPTANTDGVRFYRRQGKLGRVGVDLPRVLRDAGHRDNLLLQDGDSIDFPAYTGVVEVQGAVGAPRGVAYTPGSNLRDYVHAAGGPTRTGDFNHAYVTQPDGKVESVVAHTLLPDNIPEPRAGSVIYVPEKGTPDPPIDLLARIAIFAQILGTLVTVAVITRR